MEIGERLKLIREHKGFSLRELGRIAHVSHSFIKDIETGRSKPSLDTSKALANALEVSLSELVEGRTNDPLATRIAEENSFYIKPDCIPDDITKFAIDPKNQALIKTIQGMLDSGYSVEAIGEWLDSFMRQAKQIEKAILEKYSLQELREKGAYWGADPTPEEQKQLDKFMEKHKEGKAFPFQTRK